jgi:LysR family transcriptional regulator for metE and metH
VSGGTQTLVTPPATAALSLRKAQENVHLYVRVDAQSDPLMALKERKVDIALVPYGAPSEHAGLHSVRLFSDELVLVCAVSDPLAASAAVRAEDLSDREFLTYTRVVVPGQEYEQFLRPADLTVRRWVDMEDPATIVDLVELGQGVSILSRWFVRAAVAAERVSALRLGQDGVPIEWHAVYREELADDPQFRVLLKALSSHLAQCADN